MVIVPRMDQRGSAQDIMLRSLLAIKRVAELILVPWTWSRWKLYCCDCRGGLVVVCVQEPAVRGLLMTLSVCLANISGSWLVGDSQTAGGEVGLGT